MDSINVKVTRPPLLVAPTFDVRRVADALAESEKARILRGFNIQDQPSRPLSLAYARAKIRAGAKPIRDWVRSFTLMSAFGVQKDESGSVTVGWSQDQQQKVAWNEKWDKMAGLSPLDRQAGEDASQESFKEYVSKLWKR